MYRRALKAALGFLILAFLVGGVGLGAPRAAYGFFVWVTPTPAAATPTPAKPAVTPTPKPSVTLSPAASATPAPSAATPKPSMPPSPTSAVTLTSVQMQALSPTVRMKFAELVGDNGVYEVPAAYPAADTFQVVIDVYHQVVLVYGRDAAGQYTAPVRFMVCTTGAIKTPTPIGTFPSAGRRVRFGYFSEYDVYGQYWTQITRSIYFHSLLYTKKDADTYTASSYRSLGQRASHGCVRLLVPDARWIYYHIAPGTQIVVRRGSKADAMTAAIKAQLTRAKLPSRRPDLDPSTLPSTDNWDIGMYLSGYARVTAMG